MRSVAIGALVLLASCAQDILPIEDSQEIQVITSETDDRQYRYFELDNGMEVLLISDPESTKSAASMKVDVGSYSDPVDREGLAHFLEHMLFLGTEKYPEAGDYASYLDANAGSKNAFTSAYLTNFHFSINTDAYEGALDRFAQFFISPLFSEELVDREKNAVHSEYSTRIGEDSIARVEVIERLMNPDHPAHKFNVGNLETLIDPQDRALRDELIEFYKAYYTAEGMGLVLLSSSSLDELQALTVSKFSAVQNQGRVPSQDYEPLFMPGELPKIVEIQPNKEIRQLSLLFPMPSFQDRYASKPLSYVGMLLGQEGSGSLHDVLKDKGWITRLSAGAGQNYGNSDSFILKVGLTKQGLEHVDDIVAAFYSKVALVRSEGVEQWRYDELSKITAPQFRFSEKGNELSYVIGLANSMGLFEPQDLVRGYYLVADYDVELISVVLENLSPDNMLVSLMAPSVRTDSEVRFYGTKYRSYAPNDERVAKWQQGQFDELSLPVKNPFIPDTLDLIATTEQVKPVLLVDTGVMNVWHYSNTSFGVPRVYVQVSLDHAQKSNAHDTAIESLYYRLMTEQLNELNSYAGTAGLGFSISNGGRGALIEFGGFSDKLTTLAQKVLPQLRKPEFSQEQFERVRTTLQRHLANQEKQVPYHRLGVDLSQLLIEGSISNGQLLEASKNITADEVRALPVKLFADVKAQILVGGNITEEQTRNFVSLLNNELQLTESLVPVILGEKIAKLPVSEINTIYVESLPHPDTAVIRYYQGRNDSVQERALFSMLAAMLHQPYYQDLRTKQQLGYVVGASNITLDTTPGLGFLVQSPSASAAEVNAATDKFLPGFQQTLEVMSEDEFSHQRQAQVVKYQEKPKNLSAQVGEFWDALRADYHGFDKEKEFVEAIRALTLPEMQSAFKELFMDSPRSLMVVSPGKKQGIEATVSDSKEFQSGKEFYSR